MKSTPLGRRLGLPVAAALFASAIVFLLAIGGCANSPAEPAGATAQTEKSASGQWQCANDVEVRCGKEGCQTETSDGFTPMSVTVEESGAMSVCAYSGCWIGVGKVVQRGDFLVLIGSRLPFSTSPTSEASKADILVAIDRADGVATLKAGEFALPLLCERSNVSAK